MPWIALLVVYVTLFVCLQVHSNVLTWLSSLAIRVARFSGLFKDSLSLGGAECLRSRKSNPVRSLWIGAAPSPCCRRQFCLFRCPHFCNEPSMVVMY